MASLGPCLPTAYRNEVDPLEECTEWGVLPKEFMDAIERGYVRDERYPDLTVYHQRETGSGVP
jgi:hypothetical protein